MKEHITTITEVETLQQAIASLKRFYQQRHMIYGVASLRDDL